MKRVVAGLKKHSNNGFTLVELLVVLVVLVILAAAIIPSMMGFIDRAKKESVAAECRSVLLAAQVELNEMYGKNDSHLAEPVENFVTDTIKQPAVLDAIQTAADLPGTITEVVYTKNIDGKGNGKDDGHWIVSEARYTTKDGVDYTYTYDTAGQSGTWAEEH